MVALVVFPQGSSGTDAPHSPLGESLNSQTVETWRLAPDPGVEIAPDDIAIHLPPDSQLHSQACEMILRTFEQQPETVALYGDRMIGDQRQARPAWSPTRVQSEPGFCLPLAVRASWPQFDPRSGPLEVERRLAESNVAVLHIPSVLTSHPAALAPEGELLPEDPRFEPGKRPGTRRRRPSLPGQSSVSIIIPSAGITRPGAAGPMLARCLEGLSSLNPLPLEVIVVVGDEFQGEPPQAADGLPMQSVERGAGPFNFSRAVNCGLLASRGELVLLLNDDTEAETSDWLGRMAAHLEDPTVGAVGAALLYPDRTVQHVGVVIDNAHPLHPFRHHALADTAAHGGDVARDVIGVTGACLLARRADLLAAGGMSQEYPVSYGDIDLCLRLLRQGLRVVVEPAAALIHHESASREPVIEPWEWERFIYRWGEVDDPWYHPAFWRPSEPDHKYLNADHLAPVDPDGSWPARTTAIRPKMHPSQMNLPRNTASKMQP